MKKLCLFILFIFLLHGINAQDRLYTKEAKVSFYSKTALENIDAQNNKGLFIWDTKTGELEFSVLIKGFEFDRALMQEHFNENYMESDKFPKASFKGIVQTEKPISFNTDNSFKIKVVGKMTIHGVAKQIIIPATINIKNGIISSWANFTVLVDDYKIRIPGIVADKIDKHINITVAVPAYKKL